MPEFVDRKPSREGFLPRTIAKHFSDIFNSPRNKSILATVGIVSTFLLLTGCTPEAATADKTDILQQFWNNKSPLAELIRLEAALFIGIVVLPFAVGTGILIIGDLPKHTPKD